MATAPIRRALRPIRRRHENWYGWDWQQLRNGFISQYPICVLCLCRGRTNQANVVDHVTPHKGTEALRLDWDNLQPLCYRCHDVDKASTEANTEPSRVKAEWIRFLQSEIENANSVSHVAELRDNLPACLESVATALE